MGRKANLVLKILFPFSSMRKTVSLVKHETRMTKERWKYIQSLAREATKTLSRKEIRDEPFETVMLRCSLSREELRQIFICKKRLVLSGFYLSILFVLYSLVSSVFSQNTQGIVLSVIGGFMSFALFLLFLFQYQFSNTTIATTIKK